jgi:hypothetical protein
LPVHALYIQDMPAFLDAVLPGFLEADDDPGFWDLAIRTILGEVDARLEDKNAGIRVVELGFHKVRQWRRPHRTRWTGGGGFAWPESYTAHADDCSEKALWFRRDLKKDAEWNPVEIRKRSAHPVRGFVSLPAYTRRHAQGAVILVWRPASPWVAEGHRGVVRQMYGFRKPMRGAWRLVATQESSESRARHP